MGRYTKILDGASASDIDEAGSYYYYGFIRSEGSWVIMRTTSDGNTITYAIGGSAYSNAWSTRTGLIYKRADQYSY